MVHNAILRMANADFASARECWLQTAGAWLEYLRGHDTMEQMFLAAMQLDEWVIELIQKLPDDWRAESLERMRQAISAAVFQTPQRVGLPEDFLPILDNQLPALARIINGNIGEMNSYVAADAALRKAADEVTSRRAAPQKGGVNSGKTRKKDAATDAKLIEKKWLELAKRYPRGKSDYLAEQVAAECGCKRTKANKYKPASLKSRKSHPSK